MTFLLMVRQPDKYKFIILSRWVPTGKILFLPDYSQKLLFFSSLLCYNK